MSEWAPITHLTESEVAAAPPEPPVAETQSTPAPRPAEKKQKKLSREQKKQRKQQAMAGAASDADEGTEAEKSGGWFGELIVWGGCLGICYVLVMFVACPVVHWIGIGGSGVDPNPTPEKIFGSYNSTERGSGSHLYFWTLPVMEEAAASAVKVGMVVKEDKDGKATPASKVDIQKGDIIKSAVNYPFGGPDAFKRETRPREGEKFWDASDMVGLIKKCAEKGKNVELELLRGKETIKVEITPVNGRIGVGFLDVPARYEPEAGAYRGLTGSTGRGRMNWRIEGGYIVTKSEVESPQRISKYELLKNGHIRLTHRTQTHKPGNPLEEMPNGPTTYDKKLKPGDEGIGYISSEAGLGYWIPAEGVTDEDREQAAGWQEGQRLYNLRNPKK